MHEIQTSNPEIILYRELVSISVQIANLSQLLWDIQSQEKLEELKIQRIDIIKQMKSLN